tara:strand:+ start:80 stop:364 length:285 start_codon:yes stop_codon:yes gene_type:complete
LDEFDYFYPGTPEVGEIFSNNAKSYRISLEVYNSTNVSHSKLKMNLYMVFLKHILLDENGDIVFETGDSMRGVGMSRNRNILCKGDTVLLNIRE